MTAKRGLLIAIAIAMVALVLAWLLRFGTDDSFITYIYSRELVRGHGLTWFGTHIEGYTNFLWALWCALGIALGRDPLAWAWGLSLAALVAAILTTYRIAILRTTSAAGLVATAILATSFTFLAFGTSGLETMLQTALLTAAWFEVERLRRTPPRIAALVRLSLLAALALWTRLDSAPVIAVLGIATVPRLRSIKLWAAAVVPALVLVGGWFAWKLAFYGDLLPNTFYVKAGTGSIAHGFWFVWQFLQAYMLWPLLAGIVVLALIRRRVASALPLAIAAAHLAYVIAVGGDFMEFRFFVPIMPALAIAFAEFATVTGASLGLRALGLLAFTSAFSLRHAIAFGGVENHSIDSISQLATLFNKVRGNDWSRLGSSLRSLGDTRASIACNGAGAIPYYADLPTVDQLGLNDAWVAHEGSRAPTSYPRPGHQRYATSAYLTSRGVTFVLGSPTVIERGSLSSTAGGAFVDQWLKTVVGWDTPPAGSYEIVAAPVDDKVDLLMWYLTPDSDVSVRIAGWDRVRRTVP